MRMQNGEHTTKKKSKSSGGFISKTFILAKNDTPQTRMGKIMAIISLILIIAALVLGGMMVWKYVDARIKNGELENLVSSSDSSTNQSGTDVETSAKADEFDGNGILTKLSDLYKLNNETIGWIEIPGTKLNYPVAKGTDNLYYLNHTLKKEKNVFGTPFVDYGATIVNGYQSANLTIYAHNSKDGAMFETVKNYKDINFYKENPIINFDTIYGSGKYKIIGRFTEFFPEVPDNKSSTFYYNMYIDMNPNTKDKEQNKLGEEVFNRFLTKLDEKNYYDTGIDVKFGDSLITLSTCNDEIQAALNTPYRDVLVARKVRPGEDATVDTTKITENKDMVMPEGWIKKFKKENPYK